MDCDPSRLGKRAAAFRLDAGCVQFDQKRTETCSPDQTPDGLLHSETCRMIYVSISAFAVIRPTGRSFINPSVSCPSMANKPNGDSVWRFHISDRDLSTDIRDRLPQVVNLWLPLTALPTMDGPIQSAKFPLKKTPGRQTWWLWGREPRKPKSRWTFPSAWKIPQVLCPAGT